MHLAGGFRALRDPREVTAMALTTLHCSTCGDESSFEQPLCIDGHGPDCPELACVECGTAILIGTVDITGAPAVLVHTLISPPRAA